MALIKKLTAIGDAIRNKTGKQETMTLDDMVQEINDISDTNSENTYGQTSFSVISNSSTNIYLSSKTDKYQDISVNNGIIIVPTHFGLSGKSSFSNGNAAYSDFKLYLSYSYDKEKGLLTIKGSNGYGCKGNILYLV